MNRKLRLALQLDRPDTESSAEDAPITRIAHLPIYLLEGAVASSALGFDALIQALIVSEVDFGVLEDGFVEL
jgi:hypothetical protein